MIIPETEDQVLSLIDTTESVVLYFTATWCNPCKQFAPVVEEATNKFTNVEFIKIDIDQHFNIARKYNVRGVPTIVVIKNGEVILSKTGAMTSGSLTQLLSTYS